MKTIFFVLCAMMVGLQASALTGANGSGGGMGVVCRGPNGTIKNVELLDLWEARVIYSRTAPLSKDSVADQVEQQLQNFKNSMYAGEMCVGRGGGPDSCNGVQGAQALYESLKFETSKFLTPNVPQVHRMTGVTLQKSNDAFEVVIPSDCTIEQLVLYKDTPYGGDILINQDLVDHMDKTNEAALYIHEAVYAFLRHTGEKSSLRVRRAVGLSFSGHRFETLESFLPEQYYECTSGGYPLSRLFAYIPDKGLCAGTGVVFQVANVAGMPALGFEWPDTCREGSLNDVFNSVMPMQSWRPFGSQIGFDYSVFVSIGGVSGSKQATIELQDAPDQAPAPKAVLNCALKFKR